MTLQSKKVVKFYVHLSPFFSCWVTLLRSNVIINKLNASIVYPYIVIAIYETGNKSC